MIFRVRMELFSASCDLALASDCVPMMLSVIIFCILVFIDHCWFVCRLCNELDVIDLPQ